MIYIETLEPADLRSKTSCCSMGCVDSEGAAVEWFQRKIAWYLALPKGLPTRSVLLRAVSEKEGDFFSRKEIIRVEFKISGEGKHRVGRWKGHVLGEPFEREVGHVLDPTY